MPHKLHCITGRARLLPSRCARRGSAAIVPPFSLLVSLLVISSPLFAQQATLKTRPSSRPSAAATYTNPIGVDVADPDVIKASDSTYYLYGTSAPDGYRVWSSCDLVHWAAHEQLAFQNTSSSWGQAHFWAPDVHEIHGEYYLYYSCVGPIDSAGKTSHRICVAKSKSPLGPFVDVKAPLFDPGYATIDANAFVDHDGKGYLYFARDHSENVQPNEHHESHLYVVALGPDLTSVVGEPRLCIKPDQKWEGEEGEDRWNEGPFVMRYKDAYIMMYSAQVFSSPNYSLGFATAKSPMGPWTKSRENPILKRTKQVSGPGHNSVVESPDGKELFCCYHAHKHLEGGGERELYIDRMTISQSSDGAVHIRIKGPTVTPQPMPSGAP
jgi:GH43 family beta-xylosidase